MSSCYSESLKAIIVVDISNRPAIVTTNYESLYTKIIDSYVTLETAVIWTIELSVPTIKASLTKSFSPEAFPKCLRTSKFFEDRYDFIPNSMIQLNDATFRLISNNLKKKCDKWFSDSFPSYDRLALLPLCS